MNAVEPPPKKSPARKIVETVAEAAVSTVPYVGGPAAVLLRAGFERRGQAWQQTLFDGLNDLIERVDGLEEELADNDQLLDAVAFATAAAATTGEQEKLDALRNAVLNAALSADVDADTQTIFFRHVRDFTPSHLRLLKLLDDPQGWYADRGIEWPRMSMGSSLAGIVKAGLPELAGREPIIGQLERDLAAAGLISGPASGMMTAEGLKASRTTETGKAFLAFITDPRERLSETDT